MRIDAHQHFWKFDPVRDSWITEDMAVIRNDFLPAQLEPVLQRNGFDGTVLVQSEQTEWGNSFITELAALHPYIKGIVGWVDLCAPDIEERLAKHRENRHLKGFRHVLQGEEDRAFMLQASFKRGIRALARFGFTYDLLILPDQLCFARELVEQFPGQPFVIDHLAKPFIREGKLDGWKEDMEALALFPNVHCKVSGMVTEADWNGWKKSDFYPYLDVVVEAFGMDRLLYGSDWPVCLLAGSYEDALGILQAYFASFSKEEQEGFFGRNATRFYHLNP